MWRLHREGQLGFNPRAVGGWWERDQEIDVVAVGAEVLLVAECKWTTRPVGVKILDDLVRKAMSLPRRGQWSRIEYALFSRSGFTASLVARARQEGVRLVGLADLVPSRRR